MSLPRCFCLNRVVVQHFSFKGRHYVWCLFISAAGLSGDRVMVALCLHRPSGCISGLRGAWVAAWQARLWTLEVAGTGSSAAGLTWLANPADTCYSILGKLSIWRRVNLLFHFGMLFGLSAHSVPVRGSWNCLSLVQLREGYSVALIILLCICQFLSCYFFYLCSRWSERRGLWLALSLFDTHHQNSRA